MSESFNFSNMLAQQRAEVAAKEEERQAELRDREAQLHSPEVQEEKARKEQEWERQRQEIVQIRANFQTAALQVGKAALAAGINPNVRMCNVTEKWKRMSFIQQTLNPSERLRYMTGWLMGCDYGAISGSDDSSGSRMAPTTYYVHADILGKDGSLYSVNPFPGIQNYTDSSIKRNIFQQESLSSGYPRWVHAAIHDRPYEKIEIIPKGRDKRPIYRYDQLVKFALKYNLDVS